MSSHWMEGTFSIAAISPETEEVGIAVSTCALAVGSRVPFVSLAGAIATQSFTNSYLGERGIRLLDQGLGVDKVLPLLLEEDQGREFRQVHGLDARGRSYGFTGAECVPWAGHLLEDGFTVAGNMLVGPEVLEAMAESFHGSGNLEDLGERLMAALRAGEDAGGDKRGKESAALLIASPHPLISHNLRVDFHPQPVAQLSELFLEARKRDEQRRSRGGVLGIKW